MHNTTRGFRALTLRCCDKESITRPKREGTPCQTTVAQTVEGRLPSVGTKHPRPQRTCTTKGSTHRPQNHNGAHSEGRAEREWHPLTNQGQQRSGRNNPPVRIHLLCEDENTGLSLECTTYPNVHRGDVIQGLRQHSSVRMRPQMQFHQQ